ncbi:MAG TPA: hypothetical protein VFL54_01110 [Gammaproteobacteria bacterium]|nr:hypothetical protein [Gammaproteobacteria bacterium]
MDLKQLALAPIFALRASARSTGARKRQPAIVAGKDKMDSRFAEKCSCIFGTSAILGGRAGMTRKEARLKPLL